MYNQNEGLMPTEKLCQFCGSPLNLKANSTVVNCSYCDRENYIELDSSDIKAKSIADFYSLLTDSSKYNNLSDLDLFSTQLLSADANDIVGKYFKSYVSYRRSGNDDFKVFFMGNTVVLRKEQLFIVDHINQFSDLNYKDVISTFLKVAAPNYVNRYLESHKNRIKTEDNYAKIPRDIFICYSSKDQYIADIVVKELEKESFSCWISSRNLRKNSPDNYWNDIQAGIKNAKVFLVVSSEQAMLSKDVQKEIEFASQQLIRITEFKIDSSPHNVFFKHVLDGNRWVEGFNDLNEGINQLKNRLFQDISYLKQTGQVKDTLSYSSMPANMSSNHGGLAIPKKYVSTAIIFSIIMAIVVIQLILFLYVFSDYFETNLPDLYQYLF